MIRSRLARARFTRGAAALAAIPVTPTDPSTVATIDPAEAILESAPGGGPAPGSIDPGVAILAGEYGLQAPPPAAVEPAELLLGGEAPVPYRLLGAIFGRFSQTAPLRKVIPGGLHKGLAPPGSGLQAPYAVIQQVRSPVTYQSSGPGYLRQPDIQVKFYGPDDDDLIAAVRTWEAVFNKEMPPLAFRDGYTCLFACYDDQPLPDESEGENSDPIHVHLIRMRGQTGHAPPALV